MATIDRQQFDGNRSVRKEKVAIGYVTPSMFPKSTSGTDDILLFGLPAECYVTAVEALNLTAINGTTPKIVLGRKQTTTLLLKRMTLLLQKGIKLSPQVSAQIRALLL